MRPSWIPFGTVARAQGVRGELRVKPDDPETGLPDGIKRVCLRSRDGSERIFEVARSGTPGRKGVNFRSARSVSS